MEHNLLGFALLLLLVFAAALAIYGTAKNAIAFVGASAITICVILFIYLAVFFLH